MTEHRPGCPLRGVPWLDGAAAAERSALADRAARRALRDVEEGDPDVWREAGLAAVLRRVAPPEADRRPTGCTCGGSA